jgi:predicted nuclease of predicted toxin-antitoxin system
MRLLLDENLSESLLAALPRTFEGSSHVRRLLGDGASDRAVWDAARSGSFTILTLDSDFEALGPLLGHPPKVVWIRMHNPSNRRLTSLLAEKAAVIAAFIADPETSFLAIRERD